MCVLLAVVETTAAPHGRRHGQGLRRAHPRALRHPHRRASPCWRCSSATWRTTFSEFAGIASGMEMFGVSKYICGARGRRGRVAARGRRLLQARGEGVPRAVAGVSHLRGGGVPGAAELERGAASTPSCPPSSATSELRFAGHRHDRHHHRAVDDVLQPEQRGGEGPHARRRCSRRRPTWSPAPSPPAWWPGSSS